MATNTNSIASPMIKLDRSLNARSTQNFHLVWLNQSLKEINNDDYHKSTAELKEVVNNINAFNDVDECVDFITDFKQEMAFMIISGELNQMLIQVVQSIVQISAIFILSKNKVPHENRTKKWTKVKGAYPDIASICVVLKQTAEDCDYNSVSISFIENIDANSKPNLDQLDQSFMNTQMLKEILLTIDFQQEHIEDFLAYCRQLFVDNASELRNVEKLAKEYHNREPIWWYTYNCFLYPMLNRALRTMEVDLIIKMGFFVRDLHNHIAVLHTEQHRSDSFIIYRGQGLSQTDFDRLKSTQGGLLAFNNFLSTSYNYDVSLRFTRRTIINSDLMGVLFIMKIDPSISTTPFANVKNVSCYQREEEILFFMHSVFRIGQVKQIEKHDRLWRVDLTLTGHNDPQLHRLAESMRQEIAGPTRWYRLGYLLIKLGEFDKSEEVYEILLEQTTNENERRALFQQLGVIKHDQGKYEEAIKFFEKCKEKIAPHSHTDLIGYYNNIGRAYDGMGKYLKALSFHEKALEICQKTLPGNHPLLTNSYNNIALVYVNIGEYSKALSSHEKALEIQQKILPANYPDMAVSYRVVQKSRYGKKIEDLLMT